MTNATQDDAPSALFDDSAATRREHLARLRAIVATKGPAVKTAKADDARLPLIAETTETGEGLGDLNLLISDVSITQPPFAGVIDDLTYELIDRVGGLRPELGVHEINRGMAATPYQVVKWQITGSVSVELLHTISRLVTDAYGVDINPYTKGPALGWQKEARPHDFTAKRLHAGTLGVYFGTNFTYSAGANGVTVYQQFKHAAEANYLKRELPLEFLSRRLKPSKHVVTHIELRDHGKGQQLTGLGQDSFIALVVQLSYLLKHGAVLPTQSLMTGIYRALNRIGTRKIERSELYGMQSVLRTVERTILLPLERPAEAARFKLVPESVLLVGVPGVGKTFLEHYLMAGEYNAIFVAVDSDKIQVDLNAIKAGKPSETLTRADRITKLTGLPVILIIDDIDVILKERQNEDVVSKFLNLMQGIRQKGLYVLASTNYPEALDTRLLEPGRLSKVVHVRLPDETEREGVLFTHLQHHPFANDHDRDEVVAWATTETDGWTQRFLWELSLEGARSCLERGASTPTLADYQTGHQEILKSRNFANMKDWDERIATFVSSERKPIGFRR